MKNKTYILNTLLTLVLGCVLTIAIFVRTFAPAVIMPELDIPNIVLISLVALLADHYLAPKARRCYICIPLLAAASFGLLPFAACFVTATEAAKLALAGGVVFTAVVWLFSSMQERLSSGPAAKAAPALSGLGLYLAAQAFAGMFL